MTFHAPASYDHDGKVTSYEWDFNGDGNIDLITSEPIAKHTYVKPGEYRVKLKVVDDDKSSSSATAMFHARRRALPDLAVIKLRYPEVIHEGDLVMFEATVIDKGDTSSPPFYLCLTIDNRTLACVKVSAPRPSPRDREGLGR